MCGLLPAGLFGSAAAFGQSASATAGMMGTGSLFGSTQPATGGAFGASQPASGGLFGTPQSASASGLPFTLPCMTLSYCIVMPLSCDPPAVEPLGTGQ